MLEKKYPASLTDGGINTDDADFAVGTNQVIGGQNIRWGTTDKGRTAVVESIGGTRQISESMPSITFYTIGTAEDVENNRLIFFKFCATAPLHRITCYDKAADIEYVVLLSSQVVGGLNFSRFSPIHSARVINGLLIWTDFADTQHKINIDAGIKLNQPSYVTDVAAYTTPIEKEVISLIKRPPRLAISTEKIIDLGVTTNFLDQNTFWFAYRYIFVDRETSVVSVHSVCVPYNAADQTFNFVRLSVPFGEVIDQDVQRIEIGYRADLNPQFFGIKAWDKKNAAEAAEIAAHNAGTTALSFDFYNNQTGEPWGDSYSVKTAERCPTQSKTLELVRNRVHLSNNRIGYDTPQTTSLQIVGFDQEQGAAVTAQWYRYDYAFTSDITNILFINVLLINGLPTGNGYYDDGGIYVPGDPTVDFTQLNFIGTTVADIQASIVGDIVTVNFAALSQTAAVTNAPGGTTTLINLKVYKTGAPFQFGIVFFDEYDRKCGVVTSQGLIYETPQRDYDSGIFPTAANWQLSNDFALTEIPIWAKSYAIVRTKCLLTRFFIQGRVRNITYAVIDPTDGTYTLDEDTYNPELDGIGIQIADLQSYGIGYIFEAGLGDQVRLYEDGEPMIVLNIIAQQGDWLILGLQSIGTLGTSLSAKSDVVFEIFRPYKQISDEPFFEVGQKFFVNNYGTSARSYSVTSGQIGGDAYILEREDAVGAYLAEVMSLNDKFWFNWFDDSGRPSIVTRLGQVYLPNGGVYSNTYILGSNVNGLCEFEPLNEYFIPYECGQVQKLQVTSKVQNEQGAIMLAICQMQTASIYIGEVQLVGSDANAFVASAAGVIGTINVLKGNFGTLNPESVTEYRGSVYWVDVGNGKVIQYSTNGLFPISAYKMTKFWRQFSEQYVSMTYEQIEALGSRPYIVTTVDPHHNELLITIPKLLDVPPKGYLPDYPSEIYPFDLWDGQAKTMTYSLGMGEGAPYWQPPYTMTPEWWATLQNELYSSKFGILWQHNGSNYNNFYGVQYKSRIAVVANAEAGIVKIFQALSVESNKKPDWAYMECEEPFKQISDLLEYEWRDTEGIYYCTIRRNKIQPTATGFNLDGLMTGERMRSYAMKILFEFSANNIPLNLRFLNITFDISKGHSNYQK